jgi:hypothetical protein
MRKKPQAWFSGGKPGKRRQAKSNAKPRVLFLAIDEVGNINPRMPEAALVAA